MAKSLICKDCDTLLKNVKEATEHNVITGHSNFEETTIAVKTVVCTECGKPCRNDTEKEMHTRGTGHTSFVDKTSEAGTIDTASQMKAVKAEMMEIDGDGVTGAGAGGSGGDGGDGAPVEMVPAVVDAAMLTELQAMGFEANRATRALHFSGNSTLEGALNWLESNESAIDLDEELLVAKGSAKPPAGPKLSPEESRKKIEEQMKKMKEKREKEEKETQKLRELERIRSGKEMLIVKQKADEADRKRALDFRRMEKEEEQRARDKIKVKLEEDRKERRRKLGLPEEPTDEEKARDAEKAEATQKAAEEKKLKAFVPPKPIGVLEKVRTAMLAMKKSAGSEGPEFERYKVALSTLSKYIGNVAAHPGEEKYRTIKLTNAAFQSRVGGVSGSLEVLALAGFVKESDEAMVMPASSASPEALSAISTAITDALSNPFFGLL